MRKIHEMLRLRYEQNLGNRAITRSMGVSPATVSDLLGRVKAADLSWPLPADLTEVDLEALLYPGNPAGAPRRPEPDWVYIHRERRRKGVTLLLLWLEYKREYPNGYQYSQFCQLYQRWAQQVDVVLRQPYRAGEKMFVDFAGQTVPVVDQDTGVTRPAYIFVVVLAASNYTCAEATASQALTDWITAHCRAYEFFGGVPAVLVPDNQKTNTHQACRYDPDLNPTYRDLAAHYGTVVIPARPYKPQDKAKVETGVQIAERWVLAPLRKQTFFSLAELNAAIRPLVEALNTRPFQKLPGSRRLMFETLDRPALKPLPVTRYEFATWKKAKVNTDYHVSVDNRHYSVPYQLARQAVEVRMTATTVEVFQRGQRVASHRRSAHRGSFSTDPAHRPAAHQQHLDWTPSRLIAWADSVGPETGRLTAQLIADRPHPEQGYRACLGLMRLCRRYGPERLEAACRRALAFSAVSYRSVKSILETGLDREPLEASVRLKLVSHQNVRGAAYYQGQEVS